MQNGEGGQILIKSPFGIPSQVVTPRNVVKATFMVEDGHMACRPKGRLTGPVAQIHLFASIYQENELFIRILARSDAGGGRGRPQAEERQKRFVNGEFIDGVMSMHADCHPLFQGCNQLEKSYFTPCHSPCVRLLYILSLQYENLLLYISHSS